MSAEVWGCGHACHLMEIDYIEESPQVHVHFLTDATEYKLLGYGKVELVCHGCGECMLVYYNTETGNTSKHRKLRNSFARKHEKCPNQEFESHCPNYRANFSFVDLRMPPKARRWPERKPARRNRKKTQRKNLSPQLG